MLSFSMKAITVLSLCPVWAMSAAAHMLFDNPQIPNLPNQLPVLVLGPPVVFPPDVIHEVVTSAHPAVATHTTYDPDHGYCVYDNQTLIALVNGTTGETIIAPKLEVLQPAKSIPLNQSEISRYLNDVRIFPRDYTKLRAQEVATLSGSRNESGTVSEPAVYLNEIWINRTVAHEESEYVVCGPGSKAFFGFAADGSLRAVNHRWSTATSTNITVTPVSPNAVQASILSQFEAANITNVTVTNIDVCYYDSGNKFMQPVFRWTATTNKVTVPNVGTAPELLVGYIPLGTQPPEPVPGLFQQPANQNISTIFPRNSTIPRNRHRRRSGQINVALYPMTGDQYTTQFDLDVHNFWYGVEASTLATFVRAQDYWADPSFFTTLKEDFIDSVNVAMNRGHGNVQYFTTNEALPSTGYGPGAGGQLAYWIIADCATVRTSFDWPASEFHLAYDPWWPVFNGMHAVVGYRTEAQVYEGDFGQVGTLVGQGVSFIWAWLNTVNQNPGYNPDHYYDINTLTGNKEWWGRPSAIVVCGHSDDTAFETENLGRPGCLQQWWYDYSG